MTAPNLNVQDVDKKMTTVIDYVLNCERRVLKGEIMDLKGLDNNVVEICEAVATLPREEGQSLESKMSKLITGLEALAIAIKNQHQDAVKSMGMK